MQRACSLSAWPQRWIGRGVLCRCDSSIEKRRRLVQVYGLRNHSKSSSPYSYLLDTDVAKRIAQTLSKTLRNRTVIHCNPGPGSLSKAFLDAGAESVVCLEPNEKFSSFLLDQEHSLPSIRYVHGDFMRLDVERAVPVSGFPSIESVMRGIDQREWDSEAAATLVAPFGRISGNFIASLSQSVCTRASLFQWGRLPVVVGLLVRKDARGNERFAALPTVKSVLVERVFDIQKICDLATTNFDPAPSPEKKDTIRLLTLTPKTSASLPSVHDFELLGAFERQLCARQSDTVSSRLASCGCSGSMARTVLEKALLRGNETVAQLTPVEHIRLFNAFYALSTESARNSLFLQELPG